MADTAPTPDADLSTCVSAWLESVLAAMRPELSWSPDSLAAALAWAERVEQHWQDEASREDVEALSLVMPVECAEGRPTPSTARRFFLRTLVRTLRLLHGSSVTPLLCALSSGDETVLATVAASVQWLLQHGTERRDASSYFASSSNVDALLATGTSCESCESERPPHSPAVHLSAPPVAAAAAFSALLYSGAHATGPDAPAPRGALLAAALSLALRGAAASEKEDGGGSEEPSPAAVAVLLPLLEPRSRDAEQPPPEWMHLPSWLAALASAALPSLTDAYARALIRSHKRGPTDVRAFAARLRVLCRVSEATEQRVQAVLEAESCIAKQPLSGAKRKSREDDEDDR